MLMQYRRPWKPLAHGGAGAAGYGDATTSNSSFLMELLVDWSWDQSCLIYLLMTLAQIWVCLYDLLKMQSEEDLSIWPEMPCRKKCVTLIIVIEMKWNEIQYYKVKGLSLGVNSKNTSYQLGADSAVGYRILMYSRSSQAFLCSQLLSFELTKQILWLWKS